MLRSLLLSFAILLCGLVAMPAQANVVFIDDQDARFTVSYPDGWRKIHNQKPDDKVSIVAPGDDGAACRVRVRADKRFTIYPVRYAASVQKKAFSRGFWDVYLNEFSNQKIHEFYDIASLGRGTASFVRASYDPVIGSTGRRQMVALVSLYYDRAYIVECSVKEAAYKDWRVDFAGIMNSVDFEKILYGTPAGQNRAYRKRGLIRISGEKSIDAGLY